MNTNTVHNNWSDIKAKIKTKWSKFSENELESFKGNLDKVSAQIQKTYGVAKEQAEKEFGEFKKTLQSMKTPEKTSETPSIQPAVTIVKPIDSAPVKKDEAKAPEEGPLLKSAAV